MATSGVLVVDGEPVPYCLARIRPKGRPVATWLPAAVVRRAP